MNYMFFFDFPQNQKLSVSREFYLDLLGKSTDQGKNIALLGSTKTGKTSIVRSFIESNKDVAAVYIDLNRISTPPENFSIEFAGNAAFWFVGISKNYKKFLDIDYLLGLKELGKAISFIEKIKNESEKIKPNQRLMIESAFSFVEELGKKSNKKLVLFLDNFENILDMNNYSQIKDVLSIIDFSSRNVSYVVTSSETGLMKNKLKGFAFEEIKSFDKQETASLVEKILGKSDKKVIDDVFRYSNGNPYLIEKICFRYKEVKDVKKAFFTELVLKDSPIYNYCQKSISDSLNRARGKALLKTILKVLSSVKSAKLTEISKKIYRSAPVTKSVLERLILVDLVAREDNQYSFSNNVLKDWFRLNMLGFGFKEINDEILKLVEEELNE
ncbi:hypothetical protein HQ529_01670 [Candidatus Woesearchaeota archaeon]|nr:hypothetical protein [Candidatus Woesearchaeota archaeon]